MRMVRFTLNLLVLIALTVTLFPVLPSSSSPVSYAQDGGATQIGFETAPCFFDLPGSAVEGEDVECGYLTVPEEYDVPDGDTIRLGVVIINSTASSPAPDPLVIAQGGPGGSTIDTYASPLLGAIGNSIRNERDIILFDQRGTYYSEPFLGCDELYQAELDALGQDLTGEEDLAIAIEQLQSCRDRLSSEEVNFSAYDSVENAADIETLRAVLGYEQINLYGVSYGTLLALHMMRDNPQGLRSVILDAVLPTQLNFIPIALQNADRSFSELFTACAADPQCNANYPDLENEFFALVDELNQNPVTFELEDEDAGQTYDVQMNGVDLVDFLFTLLYVESFIPSLPRMIYEVRDGNYSLLQSWLPVIIFDPTYSQAMNLSVLCSEDQDYTLDDVILDGVPPQVIEAFLPWAEGYLELCPVLDVEQLDTFVDDPVVSDVPTLLLSGQFDPITPPVNAALAAETLSNSYNYVFPGSGHGVFLSNLCGTNIVLDFLEDPTQEPDASCIDSLADEGVSFSLPSVGGYEDPQGRFSIDVPGGWENETQTEDEFGTFRDPDTGSLIYVTALEADDLASGLTAVMQQTLDYTGDSLGGDTIELNQTEWQLDIFAGASGDIYISIVAFEEGTAYGIILQTTQANFETVTAAADEALLSFRINN